MSTQPSSKKLRLDTYLDDLDEENSRDLREALLNERIVPQKIANALTEIGHPISRDAIYVWRKRNMV